MEPVIREINCTIGYECAHCLKCFEFPADAYSHYCGGGIHLANRALAKRQMAEIRLETFKPDGSHSGIALSKPQEIEVVPDLIAMRRAVKNIIGNWS